MANDETSCDPFLLCAVGYCRSVWLWWCYRDKIGVVTERRPEQHNACGKFWNLRFRSNTFRNRQQRRNYPPVNWHRDKHSHTDANTSPSAAAGNQSADSHNSN